MLHVTKPGHALVNSTSFTASRPTGPSRGPRPCGSRRPHGDERQVHVKAPVITCPVCDGGVDWDKPSQYGGDRIRFQCKCLNLWYITHGTDKTKVQQGDEWAFQVDTINDGEGMFLHRIRLLPERVPGGKGFQFGKVVVFTGPTGYDMRPDAHGKRASGRLESLREHVLKMKTDFEMGDLLDS